MINAPTDNQSFIGVTDVSLNFNSFDIGTLQAKRLNTGALLCCPLRTAVLVLYPVLSGRSLNTRRFLI